MRSTAATALVVLLGAPAAFAQERGLVPQNERQAAENEAINLKRAAEVAARVPLEVPVKGAPYSADVIVGTKQTLADGNHISKESTGRVYRDGEGRTRREQEGAVSVLSRTNAVITTKNMTTSIVDPVAGYSYSLDAEHKIAWRTPIGTSKKLFEQAQAAAVQLKPGAGERSSQPLTEEQKAKVAEEIAKMKAELDTLTGAAKEAKANAVMARGGAYAYEPNRAPLQHATIDGLAVEGRKNSETIPAGQIGNELPITITSEEWTSTDLKVLVLTKHSDPRTGESTYRLGNVVRAEPDPSLFMVPPDYTVKDTGIRKNNE
jgi:hypothetical protein